MDRSTRQLSPRAAELLGAVGAEPDGPIRGEYLTTMVELVSGVHGRVDAALAEVRALLEQVVIAADGLGLAMMASGTHPFAGPEDSPVVPSERYDVVARRNGWWGRRMIICGTHVHVGVPDRDQALPLVQWLAACTPLILALSASSPWFEGEDTGFDSHRALLFSQLATNGLPPAITDWPGFERYAADLVRAGMISRPTEIRWDVRPAPRFGTVECRIADSTATLAELGCLAAWVQCLTEYFWRAADRGATLPRPQPWLIRENKWRAARYGLSADIISPAGDPVPLRSEVDRWLQELAPLADDLGCSRELAVASELLTSGNSAERQRRLLATGADLQALVDAMVAETRGTL